ncbi:DEAD/DEAH box helicase [Dissulfurispira sp.]|uniref:DEAD/DEAH box helicase n=1 Tax=Dissulfurispira sp. TaxID=2817609 RepID=UPI002FD8F9EB
MPVLDWIGKKQVINHDKEVPFRPLKRVESLSVGESENLIIKGDNLEALKALLPYYYNKVKCIYIDPPYNTGNENWIYNDKVDSPEIRKWLGRVVGSEGVGKDYKGLVMWFVPSDAIRTQTLNALKDKTHPYRFAIDEYFDNKVVVLDNKEALSVKAADIKDNVCIIVSTLAAFKREDTEGLKAYEDNGSLIQHFEYLNAEEKENITKSLFEVIRMNNPLIIIDEGHNAKTWLSLDLITQLNPCFVLEFTATPLTGKSNVLIEVPAYELKEEQMVKLPINLKNETHWETTLQAAKNKRDEIEKIAGEAEKASGEYIRPIVLIQAEQEKESDRKIHVHQIKEYLINELKIPEDHIAIKTGKQDDIGDINLFSPLCSIRYIITRDAIKEGWDCSFAYVLASVFNVGSSISVEQLIGRILRLPNAKKKSENELNESYVFTSAERFQKAADAVIKGMVENGYSERDINTQGKQPEPISVKARLSGIKIPYLSLKDDAGKIKKLSYKNTLIGNSFSLSSYSFHDSEIANLEAKGIRIDINKEGDITKEAVKVSEESDPYTVEDESSLIKWLLTRIKFDFIPAIEVRDYIKRTVGDLASKYSIAELFQLKFSLRDKIILSIENHLNAYAKARFDRLFADNRFVIDLKQAYTIPDALEIYNPHQEAFQKSIFEKTGRLNDEEYRLAKAIDDLSNVKWWFRNLDRGGFYIQGYLPHAFNPDFILETKSGIVVALEYKGEHLADRYYKEDIGNLWGGLNDKYKFMVVTKKRY